MDISSLDYRNILFSPVFSKLVVFLVILVIGIILGRVIGKVVYRVLHELGVNNLLKKATKVKISLERTLGSAVSYFIYFVAIIMALTTIGISTTVLNIVLVAVAIVLILAAFFAIRDFFPNLVAGMIIQKKGIVLKGDDIEIQGFKGKVSEISALEMVLSSAKGEKMYVPNVLVTKSLVMVKRSRK